jgi:hypothetical protein
MTITGLGIPVLAASCRCFHSKIRMAQPPAPPHDRAANARSWTDWGFGLELEPAAGVRPCCNLRGETPIEPSSARIRCSGLQCGTAMNASSDRAGRLVRQAGGYTAFIPAGLPPEPPLTLDTSLLSRADQAVGRRIDHREPGLLGRQPDALRGIESRTATSAGRDGPRRWSRGGKGQSARVMPAPASAAASAVIADRTTRPDCRTVNAYSVPRRHFLPRHAGTDPAQSPVLCFGGPIRHHAARSSHPRASSRIRSRSPKHPPFPVSTRRLPGRFLSIWIHPHAGSQPSRSRHGSCASPPRAPFR